MKKMTVLAAEAAKNFQPTPLRELIRQQSDAMRAIHIFGDFSPRVDWGGGFDRVVEERQKQTARCQ